MPPTRMVFFSFAAKTCIRQPESLDLEFKRSHPGEILPCVSGLSTGSEKQCSLSFSNSAFQFKGKYTH